MYEARNVLRQNQSHPLARDDNVVDNDRHGEKSKLRFISGENPFVPGHRDPTVPVTQCNGLCHVTLSVMHLRNEASASSSRNQTTYPQNDAVLGVAPNQTARSVDTVRCSTAMTWATKCTQLAPCAVPVLLAVCCYSSSWSSSAQWQATPCTARAQSGFLVLSPSTHSSYTPHAMPHD